MNTKYLIIGNSVAGINASLAIREIDSKGKLVIVSDENFVYSRPLISYYLGGKLDKQRLIFKDDSFYKENNLELLLSTKVVKIDVKRKEAYLENGKRIKYKKLLLATGGLSIMPPIEGLERVKEGVFSFIRFSDAQALSSYIEKNNIKEAVVLGAGLIGLKCTEGLVEKGLNVTIIELANRILANTFDEKASFILEESLKGLGCRIIKEDTIEKIITDSGGRINKVILRSKKELSTNLLVLAIGVRPNLQLVKDTPIKFDRGIIVDNFMQTNIKDVYAAGDVAQAMDFLSLKNSTIAIWPVAARTGKIAGFNMAGKKVSYEGLFIMNSVELAGIPTISFGITNPQDKENYEVLFRENRKDKFYRKIVLKDNRIVGAIFLGRIERAGIICGLIKSKLNVSNFKNKLLSDEFGFLILPKEYRKHMVKGEGIEV